MNTINTTSCCYGIAVLIQEFSVTVFFIINKHRSASVPNSNSNINLFVADQVINFKWPLRWWGKTALLPLLQRGHSSRVLLHLTALIWLLELYHSLSACVPLSISTELLLHTLTCLELHNPMPHEQKRWQPLDSRSYQRCLPLKGFHVCDKFVNLLTSRTPWCTVVLMFKGFLEGFSPMKPRVSSMYCWLVYYRHSLMYYFHYFSFYFVHLWVFEFSLCIPQISMIVLVLGDSIMGNMCYSSASLFEPLIFHTTWIWISRVPYLICILDGRNGMISAAPQAIRKAWLCHIDYQKHHLS